MKNKRIALTAVLILLSTLASASFFDDILNFLSGCQSTQAGGRICFDRTNPATLAYAVPQPILQGQEFSVLLHLKNIPQSPTGMLWLNWDIWHYVNGKVEIVDSGSYDITPICTAKGYPCSHDEVVDYGNPTFGPGNYIIEAVVAPTQDITPQQSSGWLTGDSGSFTISVASTTTTQPSSPTTTQPSSPTTTQHGTTQTTQPSGTTSTTLKSNQTQCDDLAAVCDWSGDRNACFELCALCDKEGKSESCGGGAGIIIPISQFNFVDWLLTAGILLCVLVGVGLLVGYKVVDVRIALVLLLALAVIALILVAGNVVSFMSFGGY